MENLDEEDDDIEDLRSKYGIPADEKEEEVKEEGEIIKNNNLLLGGEWNGMEEIQKLNEKNSHLLLILDMKEKEIGRLEQALEVLQPAEGVMINNNLKNVILQKGDINTLDVRDRKILQLSKKIRNLNLNLEKEKVKNSSLLQQVDILECKIINFQRPSSADSESGGRGLSSSEVINSNISNEEYTRLIMENKNYIKQLEVYIYIYIYIYI